MLWSKGSWSRREVVRLLAGTAAVAALAGLPGCGFQPIYGQGKNDSAVSAELASIRVDPLRDRVGQIMHNFLRDRLNPRGQPGSPSYRLQVQLTENISELGVRRDETATRANLHMEATFSLLRYDGEATLLKGRSTSTTSYDILTNPFATTVSEDDARERALREVADEIQTRLALFFAKG